MKDKNKAAKPRLNELRPRRPQGLQGKLPPQVPELEEAVLGALMLEKNALNDVIDILKPESFYSDKHRLIYKAIIELYNEGMPIDLLTVTEQLRKHGDLESVGGAAVVTGLTMKVNTSAHISTHARIISEKYIKRELIEASYAIQHEAYEDSTDVFDLLDRMQKQLFDISEVNIRKDYLDIKTVFKDAMGELERKRDQTDGLTGVGTGFVSLDRVTSGWQPSDLVIIAARPGMGKTSFILSAMRNAAVDFQKSTLIFSLEMSAVQLVLRLISGEAEIESQKIKNGQLADYEWESLLDKTDNLAKSKIYIDDTPAISILEVRAKSRRLKSQHGLDLIIIDYLQLMTGNAGKNGNREQEIAGISRALKQLAKELEVPVIALAQLSRAVETRGGDKKPMLSDLRESGSIEQDADQVLFLYRPEYYEITEDEEGNPTKDSADVMIAKNRHGALDTVKLKFEGKYTKFRDWEDVSMNFTDGSYGFPSLPDDAGSDFTSDVQTYSSAMNDEPDSHSVPPPSSPPGNDPLAPSSGDEDVPF